MQPNERNDYKISISTLQGSEDQQPSTTLLTLEESGNLNRVQGMVKKSRNSPKSTL